jgi:putative chitinase
MPLNRKPFFDQIRIPLFRGSLGGKQVAGLDLLLTTWEHLYRERMPATQLAYVFGTTYHETAATMQPVKEYGSVDYFTRMYDITGSRPALARSLGNTTPGDGARYAGRGFVQLTGKANYRKATEKLAPLGATVDLVAKPDDAMLPDVAALVLFEGMEEGWFTGVKLDDTVDGNVDGDEHADFIRARRIINGTDRAEQIARYADVFLAGLTAMGVA